MSESDVDPCRHPTCVKPVLAKTFNGSKAKKNYIKKHNTEATSRMPTRGWRLRMAASVSLRARRDGPLVDIHGNPFQKDVM
jgi:hypothetical protein